MSLLDLLKLPRRERKNTVSSAYSQGILILRRLGTVLHISHRGTIIVRTEKVPPIGNKSIVFDKKAQEIGIIIDVFGPVRNPYVAIRPNTEFDAKKIIGQVLYMHKK